MRFFSRLLVLLTFFAISMAFFMSASVFSAPAANRVPHGDENLILVGESIEGDFSEFKFHFTGVSDTHQGYSPSRYSFTLKKNGERIVDSMQIMPWQKRQDIYWFMLEKESKEASTTLNGAVIVLRVRSFLVREFKDLSVQVRDKKTAHEKNFIFKLSQK